MGQYVARGQAVFLAALACTPTEYTFGEKPATSASGAVFMVALVGSPAGCNLSWQVDSKTWFCIKPDIRLNDNLVWEPTKAPAGYGRPCGQDWQSLDQYPKIVLCEVQNPATCRLHVNWGAVLTRPDLQADLQASVL